MIKFGLSLLLMFSITLQAQETLQNPIAYFDFFNQEHSALAQKNMEYLQYAVHSDDLQVIAEKRLALLEQVQSTQLKISQVPAFDNDGGLKGTMTEVLDTYEQLFEIGFQEIELLKAESQESFDQMERYLDAQTAAEKRMAQASASLLVAQHQFALANNIHIIEDGESVTEAEQLNALNAYQRDIFLRSFRIGKLNADFLAAMEQQDAEKLVLIRQNLIGACQAEVPVLRKKPDFKGNTVYRDAVVAQAEMIAELAEQEYQAVVSVLEKGDQLTPEDVEAYNQAITKINTVFNPAAEKVNIALQNLLRSNVPKPAVRGVKQI